MVGILLRARHVFGAGIAPDVGHRHRLPLLCRPSGQTLADQQPRHAHRVRVQPAGRAEHQLTRAMQQVDRTHVDAHHLGHRADHFAEHRLLVQAAGGHGVDPCAGPPTLPGAAPIRRAPGPTRPPRHLTVRPGNRRRAPTRPLLRLWSGAQQGYLATHNPSPATRPLTCPGPRVPSSPGANARAVPNPPSQPRSSRTLPVHPSIRAHSQPASRSPALIEQVDALGRAGK